MSSTPLPRLSPLWSIHFAVLLFGLAGLFGKAVAQPAWVIVLGRTVFAALAVALVVLWRHRVSLLWQMKSPQRWRLLLAGAVLALHWTTFFAAVQYSTVAIALLGFASFPVFVALLEPWWFAEQIRRQEWAMIALVTLGLLLVVPEWRFEASATQGLLLAVLSGALFAVLALLNRSIGALPVLTSTFWQNTVAAAVLLPLWWWLPPVTLTLQEWSALLFLGVVCTALAHGLFIASLAVLPARQVAVITGLEPVYGIGFAWYLFQEQPTWLALAGGACIVVATVWASLAKPQHG